MEGTGKDPIEIFYIFKFLSGNSKHFTVRLDPEKMECLGPGGEPPEWTAFRFHACEGCPIKDGPGKHCPVALNISAVSEDFGDLSASEATHVQIMTSKRDYAKSTTIQEGLTALLGLCMAASACPIMGKLKPLAGYHLPFATLNESVFRVASMYLLVQYFLQKKGREADWQMKGLTKIYEDIQKVNRGMSERLRLAASKDASLKAIANLDHTASLVPFVVNETLDEIEASLSSYMEE